MVKYSIIIPLYNKEKYIEKSVMSVLNSDCGSIEIIIIDDGSKDKSGEIADRLSVYDSRIRVFHIENNGVSNARNIGIEKASGEYLHFLDADDTVESGFYKSAEEFLKKGEYDIIFASYKKVDRNGEEAGLVNVPFTGEILPEEMLKSFLEIQTRTGFYGYCGNKLVRRELIKKNNIAFDAAIKLAEDLDFWIKVFYYMERIYFIPIYAYNYLLEAENSTYNAAVDYYKQLLIKLRIKELLVTKNICGKDEPEICYQISKYVFFYINNHLANSYKDFCEHIEKIYDYKEPLESIVYCRGNLYYRMILFFAARKRVRALYFTIKTKRKFRKLTRG